MLPRPHRLSRKRDFEQVYRQGRAWAHSLAVLYVLPRPSGQRLGTSVSKKIGKAVCRNRVRRRLQEILGQELSGWKQGWEGIIVARPEAAEAGFSSLREAVRQLARRAGLPREPGEPVETPYIMPGRPGALRRPPGRDGGSEGRGSPGVTA